MAPTTRGRSAQPPRTAASGCGSRTWRSSTTRCRSTRRCTSRSPDLLDRDLVPSLFHQGGVVVRMANAQGTDVLVPDRLPHHGVPHGDRIARALDREPGLRRLPVAHYPGLVALAQ